MLVGIGLPPMSWIEAAEPEAIYPLIRQMWLSDQIQPEQLNQIFKETPDFKRWWDKQNYPKPERKDHG